MSRKMLSILNGPPLVRQSSAGTITTSPSVTLETADLIARALARIKQIEPINTPALRQPLSRQILWTREFQLTGRYQAGCGTLRGEGSAGYRLLAGIAP
jgi:hypothetical protein